MSGFVRLTSVYGLEPILLNPSHIVCVLRRDATGARVDTRDGEHFSVIESVDELEAAINAALRDLSEAR